MRETLRLSPTAPIRVTSALQDITIGGKYAIKKGDNIAIDFSVMGKDPAVWGSDVGSAYAA